MRHGSPKFSTAPRICRYALQNQTAAWRWHNYAQCSHMACQVSEQQKLNRKTNVSVLIGENMSTQLFIKHQTDASPLSQFLSVLIPQGWCRTDGHFHFSFSFFPLPQHILPTVLPLSPYCPCLCPCLSHYLTISCLTKMSSVIIRTQCYTCLASSKI